MYKIMNNMKRARQNYFDTQRKVYCEFSRQSGTSYVTNKKNYKHMKTKNLFLLLLLFVVSNSFAQQDTKPKIEELHNKKWAYLVENVQLTPTEAARVKPLFLEFETSVWKIIEDSKPLYRSFHEKKDSRSEADYNQINERFVNSEMYKAQLLKNYYGKLKKLLSAETIFKYFNAERSYRKDLIENWQGKHSKHKGVKRP